MGANDILAATAGSAAVIERATLHPWIVHVGYDFDGGEPQSILAVVERRMDDQPDPLGHLPTDSNLRWYKVFPASTFETMAHSARPNYVAHYRAFLMWRKAKAIGKHVADMTPWVDYDPIDVHENQQRWAHTGVR